MIGIRLPPDLRERLEQIAASEHRTLSNLIRFIILQWLELQEKAAAEGEHSDAASSFSRYSVDASPLAVHEKQASYLPQKRKPKKKKP